VDISCPAIDGDGQIHLKEAMFSLKTRPEMEELTCSNGRVGSLNERSFNGIGFTLIPFWTFNYQRPQQKKASPFS